ncbi:DUF397 domain-containing protein [Streptomyces solisilvae]|uniref:DUF397 domain-containing protein n=1 Tax=Streptomyces malaysiensis TaxID=92644 RepID=UPI003698E6D7
MNNNLFTSPIKESTWTAACGGGKCCIEVAELDGGGFALRNNQAPDHVIRCTAEELRTFYARIPGILDEA